MKYWSLEVVYPGQNRQNDYPMGDSEQFEDITYFINWNIEQCKEILDEVPEFQQVIDALKYGRFECRECDCGEAESEIIVRVEVKA